MPAKDRPMPRLTYAVADLHGRADLIAHAYRAIAAHAAAAAATLVHLGDYVDRGPDSRGVVAFLRDPATLPAGWRRVVLKGNHEEMMVEASAGRRWANEWGANGGDATLASYGGLVPRADLDWVAGLPLLHTDAHRVYVHAAVDPAVALEAQDPRHLLWARYRTGDPGGHGARHVVHGHQPYEDGPLLHPGRTDLDTLAWATGRLVVGVFDDAAPGGPVDFIEVRRPD